MIDIKQFHHKAKQYAIRRGHEETSDDFAQEAAIAYFRGRKASIGQLFIDFLRKEYGDCRVRGNSKNKLRRNNIVYIDAIREEDVGQNDKGVAQFLPTSIELTAE
jgi:hypothetical protein